jgi:membrane associated rhomboid family serine protease
MRPARRRSGFGDTFTFGGRVPAAVGAIIAATVGLSLLGALGRQGGMPLLAYGVLDPAAVLGGQVWRLVTWVLFETEPLNLLFGCMTLYFFGRDLYFTWGERRFVVVYFATAALTAAATTVVALFWPAASGPALGLWPVISALIVAWAVYFPDRQILLFFALPVSGRAMLYVTLGGTLFFAVMGRGLGPYVPHLIAELGMLAWTRSPSTGRFWERLRMAAHERNLKRRSRHLKVIDRDRERDGSRSRWLN